MKEFLGGLIIALIIGFILWPYYSLTYLKDIAVELENIKKELRNLNERLR